MYHYDPYLPTVFGQYLTSVVIKIINDCSFDVPLTISIFISFCVNINCWMLHETLGSR